MYPKINRHAYHSQRHSIVVCPTATVGVNSAAAAVAVAAAVAAIPIATPPQSIPFVQCQYDRHQRNKNVEQCHTNGGAQSTQANAQWQGGTGECNGIPDVAKNKPVNACTTTFVMTTLHTKKAKTTYNVGLRVLKLFKSNFKFRMMFLAYDVRNKMAKTMLIILTLLCTNDRPMSNALLPVKARISRNG